MHSEQGVVGSIVSRLVERLGRAPDVAIVLGSGLGAVVEQTEVRAAASFEEVGLPGSTVPGHAGRVLVGDLAGVRVALLAGRVHLYEGHSPAVVVRGVRALHRWGVRRLVLTASVGAITEGLEPGALMLVSDHLNFQNATPLAGPPYGERFPDMTRAYDPALRAWLREAAARAGIPLREGVYAAMPGPAYETPAEIRFLRTIGADVVGMSTVPEVLAAAELGLPTAAIAVVSNLAAGISGRPLSHDEVTEIAGPASGRIVTLLQEALGALGTSDGT